MAEMGLFFNYPSLRPMIAYGDNATIGAGAVVVKDVPKDSTVAGNPAKVISMKTPARFIWRKWQPK